MLCDDQEGWGEVGGEGEVQEGGDMFVPVAGLYCRMVDPSIALQCNYPPIKNKFYKRGSLKNAILHELHI